MSRLRLSCPICHELELIVQTFRISSVIVPDVPDVVRDSPHLCVLAHLIQFFNRSRSGRKTQNDRAAALVESLPDHSDVGSAVRTTADAVHLNKINTPSGIEFSDGIVISLGLWLGRVRAKIVEVPGTGVGNICARIGCRGRSFDWYFVHDRLLGNTAQNVDTKLEHMSELQSHSFIS